MITKRDQDIINFITDFHVVTLNQVYRLFFKGVSLRYSQKRLEYLFKQGYIKRTKSTIDNSFAYYVDKKPCQIHHDLIRSELFVNLKNRYNVLEWSNELPVVNIRPDAMAYFKDSSFSYINDNGIIFPVFIEIHINNKFNFQKYIDLVKNNDLKLMFGIIPRVVICSDRDIKIPNGIGIKFKVTGVDMNGLDCLFK